MYRQGCGCGMGVDAAGNPISAEELKAAAGAAIDAAGRSSTMPVWAMVLGIAVVYWFATSKGPVV